jgi:hypothetical protein
MEFWPWIPLHCANSATQYLQRECSATRLRPQDLVRTALLITYYGKAVQFDPGPYYCACTALLGDTEQLGPAPYLLSMNIATQYLLRECGAIRPRTLLLRRSSAASHLLR